MTPKADHAVTFLVFFLRLTVPKLKTPASQKSTLRSNFSGSDTPYTLWLTLDIEEFFCSALDEEEEQGMQPVQQRENVLQTVSYD